MVFMQSVFFLSGFSRNTADSIITGKQLGIFIAPLQPVFHSVPDPSCQFRSRAGRRRAAAAGHDTTHSAISGGLPALLQNLGEMAKLRADPEFIGNAVGEFIR